MSRVRDKSKQQWIINMESYTVCGQTMCEAVAGVL